MSKSNLNREELIRILEIKSKSYISDNFAIIINYLINLLNLFLKKQQKSQKSLYIP